MDSSGNFRRNTVLIALAHVLVIGGIVWWTLRAEHQDSRDEPVNWMDLSAGAPGGPGNSGGVPPAESGDPATTTSETNPKPSTAREENNGASRPPRPLLSPSDADREFATRQATPMPTPPPTPKPTPTPAPKPTPPPTPKPTRAPDSTPPPAPAPKPKTKPTSKPKEEKTAKAEKLEKEKPKATPKSEDSPKPKSDAQAKSNKTKQEKDKNAADRPKKSEVSPSKGKSDDPETAARKTQALTALRGDGEEDSTSGNGTSKGSGRSTGTSGEGSGNSTEIIAVYNEMIRDRFHSQWDQPTVAGGAAAGNDVALLTIRVEKDGRISKAFLSTPSGMEQMDASVRTAAEHVKKIEPLPAALAKKGYYEVTIKFNRTD